MSATVLGSPALARSQYDQLQPRALSKVELLELFAVLYDVTMPLAYVKAVEKVFGHIKCCSYLPGHADEVRIYNHVLPPADVQQLYDPATIEEIQ